MRSKRSERRAAQWSACLLSLVVLSAVAFYSAGCGSVAVELKEIDEIVEDPLLYDETNLSKFSAQRRIDQIDREFAEPRTSASVKLSRETCLHSITSASSYGALWRGARACVWLSGHSDDKGEQRRYALEGIQWGEKATQKADVTAEAYYYLGLSQLRYFELSLRKTASFALAVKENLNMAAHLNPQLDHCGPKLALGKLLILARKVKRNSVGTQNEGLNLIREAAQNCSTFGRNHLELAIALIDTGKHDDARVVLDELFQPPSPPDHTADHQAWLTRGSELLNDLPGK